MEMGGVSQVPDKRCFVTVLCWLRRPATDEAARRFVTGHDFSRAANALTMIRALAPAGTFPPETCLVSSACSGLRSCPSTLAFLECNRIGSISLLLLIRSAARDLSGRQELEAVRKLLGRIDESRLHWIHGYVCSMLHQALSIVHLDLRKSALPYFS